MLEVKLTGESADLEVEVRQDLQSFEVWFQGLGNGPLVKPEVAILRTYLYWKFRGEKHAPAGR